MHGFVCVPVEQRRSTCSALEHSHTLLIVQGTSEWPLGACAQRLKHYEIVLLSKNTKQELQCAVQDLMVPYQLEIHRSCGGSQA